MGGRLGLGRLALPVGVVGLVAGCLIPWRAARRTGLFDDVFWHWASGQWMLRHGRVLSSDVFSYTVRGHLWHTPEWGYDVVLAQAVRSIGNPAFWLLSAGLATLAVIVTVARARVAGAGWTWSGLLAVECGAAVTLLLDVRPQMVSYVLFATLLLVLDAGRRRRRWLWLVPVVFVLWANMHGSFLLGLTVLALEVMAALFARLRPQRLRPGPLPVVPALACIAGAALATLVNPFGPGVYASAYDVAANPTVRALVAEWQSPDFHDPVVLAVVAAPVLLTVVGLSAGSLRHGMPAVDLVLSGLLLVATLQAMRFLPYFAIAWCGLAARTSPLQREQLRPSLLTWPAAAVVGLAFFGGPSVPAGATAGSVPVRAVDYVAMRPGRVFSTYVWNDYLVHRGIPVFVDGRTELYTSTGILRRYLDVADVAGDPDPLLRSYGVRMVLWPERSALSVFLEHDPAWKVSYRAGGAVVFSAVGPPGRR